MKLKIIRIEEGVVTCKLEDGTLLDVAKMWFNKNIVVDDIIEFDVASRDV